MSDTAPEHAHSSHPALKVAAPLIVIAAQWATSKVLNAAYSGITGKEPPDPTDRRVSLSTALTWTIATAATAAVIQMVIYRAAASTTD